MALTRDEIDEIKMKLSIDKSLSLDENVFNLLIFKLATKLLNECDKNLLKIILGREIVVDLSADDLHKIAYFTYVFDIIGNPLGFSEQIISLICDSDFIQETAFAVEN
jgi:hypothetical protein